MNESSLPAGDLDLLKFAVAIGVGGVNYLQGALRKVDLDPASWASLVTMLESISMELLGTLCEGEDDLDWYSAGHPVYTITEFPDCDCVFAHTWHPDPRNPRNSPRELAVLACPRGGLHRLVVVGPGEVDTVDVGAPGAG